MGLPSAPRTDGSPGGMPEGWAVSIPLAQHQLSKSSVGLLGCGSRSRHLEAFSYTDHPVKALGAGADGVLRPRRIWSLSPRGASRRPRGARGLPRVVSLSPREAERSPRICRARLVGREARPTGREARNPGRTARPGSVGLAFRGGRLAPRGEPQRDPAQRSAVGSQNGPSRPIEAKIPGMSCAAGRRDSAVRRFSYQTTARCQIWSRLTKPPRGTCRASHHRSTVSSDRKSRMVAQVWMMSRHHRAAGTSKWITQP